MEGDVDRGVEIRHIELRAPPLPALRFTLLPGGTVEAGAAEPALAWYDVVGLAGTLAILAAFYRQDPRSRRRHG